VRRLCAEGEADLKLDRREDAATAFKAALVKNPQADCARAGIDDSEETSAARALDRTKKGIPDLLFVVGLLAVLLFLILLLGHFKRVYRVFARLPIVGRLLSPRLSLGPLDDKATKLDVGAAMSARIRERLQRFREEAIHGGEPDYELDFGTAGDDFADLVSSSSGLKDALGKVREVSDHTKIVAAVLDLLYAALPIRQLAVTGVLDPPDRRGVASTFSLENSGRLEASATLSGPPLTRDPTADDYLRLSQPSAVWVQYEVARVLSGGLVEPDAAESYALVREGLDRQLAGQYQAARDAYEAALALNRRNWAAFVNLTVLEARLAKNFPRSIKIGEEAWREMQEIGGSL
jgi:tetratricopeptide (TPR) repeat protein